jgi:hypothetical protein
MSIRSTHYHQSEKVGWDRNLLEIIVMIPIFAQGQVTVVSKVVYFLLLGVNDAKFLGFGQMMDRASRMNRFRPLSRSQSPDMPSWRLHRLCQKFSRESRPIISPIGAMFLGPILCIHFWAPPNHLIFKLKTCPMPCGLGFWPRWICKMTNDRLAKLPK